MIAAGYTRLRLVPVTQREAKAFVAKHHRHNEAPITSVFQVGIQADGELVGVAMVGLPKARLACDGETLEVNRSCTLGTKNANSMLYGACARAAKSLGYSRLITYTLPEECGASLLAAGWVLLGEIDAKGSWQEKRGKTASQTDLYGAKRMPLGPKLKWEKRLAAGAEKDA